MNEITTKELKELVEKRRCGHIGIYDYILIDVREPYEFEDGCIPEALNVPMDEVIDSEVVENSIQEYDKVIFSCRSGKRSKAVNYMLKKLHKTHNTYNLIGGYLEWKENE